VADAAGRSEATGRPVSRMLVDVLGYLGARLLLTAVLGVAIYAVGHVIGLADFPVAVAAMMAIVIAFPLGIWVFAPLRRRATASIAAYDEGRRRDRAQLRARLRGDEPPPEQ
jgi:FtsH-binding integral membrane protein